MGAIHPSHSADHISVHGVHVERAQYVVVVVIQALAAHVLGTVVAVEVPVLMEHVHRMQSLLQLVREGRLPPARDTGDAYHDPLASHDRVSVRARTAQKS